MFVYGNAQGTLNIEIIIGVFDLDLSGRDVIGYLNHRVSREQSIRQTFTHFLDGLCPKYQTQRIGKDKYSSY